MSFSLVVVHVSVAEIPGLSPFVGDMPSRYKTTELTTRPDDRDREAM